MLSVETEDEPQPLVLVLLGGAWENGQNGLGGSMSIELISVLIAVVAIGATLGGLILISNRGLRQDMAQQETRLREDISQLRDDIKQLGDRVGRLEHSHAHLGGLLEGLREAITGRVKAS